MAVHGPGEGGRGERLGLVGAAADDPVDLGGIGGQRVEALLERAEGLDDGLGRVGLSGPYWS